VLAGGIKVAYPRRRLAHDVPNILALDAKDYRQSGLKIAQYVILFSGASAVEASRVNNLKVTYLLQFHLKNVSWKI
jgi:hypothetical protein